MTKQHSESLFSTQGHYIRTEVVDVPPSKENNAPFEEQLKRFGFVVPETFAYILRKSLYWNLTYLDTGIVLSYSFNKGSLMEHKQDVWTITIQNQNKIKSLEFGETMINDGIVYMVFDNTKQVCVID